MPDQAPDNETKNHDSNPSSDQSSGFGFGNKPESWDAFKYHAGKHESDINYINRQLTEIKADIKNIQSDINRLDAKIDNLENKLDAKIDNLENKLAAKLDSAVFASKYLSIGMILSGGSCASAQPQKILCISIAPLHFYPCIFGSKNPINHNFVLVAPFFKGFDLFD